MFSCIEEQNGGHLLYYVIILEEVSFCDFGNLCFIIKEEIRLFLIIFISKYAILITMSREETLPPASILFL